MRKYALKMETKSCAFSCSSESGPVFCSCIHGFHHSDPNTDNCLVLVFTSADAHHSHTTSSPPKLLSSHRSFHNEICEKERETALPTYLQIGCNGYCARAITAHAGMICRTTRRGQIYGKQTNLLQAMSPRKWRGDESGQDGTGCEVGLLELFSSFTPSD
jgi:hypothetical protein